MRRVFSLPSTSRLARIAAVAAIALLGHFIAEKMFNVPAQRDLVIIFGIAFFYPVLRHPVFGIYLLFFIMPFVPFFRRLYYLQYARPLADPLIIIGDLIITFIIIGLYFEFRARKDSHNVNRTFNNIVIIYFLYLILRTFFFNILPVTDAILRFRLYGPSVLLFFIGSYFAGNTNLLKRIWLLSFWIAIFAALYGLKQLIFGYNEAERIWFSSISFSTLFIKGIARPFSFFQSPAAFADYMQIGIISIIVLSNWGGIKIGKVFLFPFLLLFFYGALITSVRSNWIGILVSLFLWIFVIQFKTTRARVGILASLLAVFALTQVMELHSQSGLGLQSIFKFLGGGLTPQYADLLVTERASAISNPFEEHSLLSRVALWKYLFILSFDPIMAVFGRGVGTLNADSLYVTYLAEFGYPGAIFITFLVIFVIIKGFSLIDKSDSHEIRSLARGITVMNIVFAIINITGTHIHSFPGDVYFWFWNGVLIKLEYQQRSSARLIEDETACYN